MNASKVFWRGVVCALAGATLWGFSGACIQFLAESYEVSSAFISAVRAGVAALLFAVFVFVTRREALLSLLGSPAARPTLVLFGVGLYLSQITYAVSVALTNAGTATVLQATCTVFVMLITCARARRLPRVADFVGLMCAMAAATLIATQGDWGVIVLPVAGLAWGIANALSETLYIMAPQRLYGRWDRPTIIACGMVIGGVAAVLVWLIGEAVVSLLAPSVGLGPAFASPGSDTALSTTVQASSGSGAGVSFADSAPGAPSSVLADIFGIGGSLELLDQDAAHQIISGFLSHLALGDLLVQGGSQLVLMTLRACRAGCIHQGGVALRCENLSNTAAHRTCAKYCYFHDCSS